MRAARVWRYVHLTLALALLAASAWLGISEGLIATHTGVTTGQHVATATQLCYGVFGLVSLVAVLTRRRWALVPLWLWGVALTATAALAPVVWGKSGARPAVLAGAAAAVVSAFVIWGGHRHVAAGGRASG